MSADAVELRVPPGALPRQVAEATAQAGVDVPPDWLFLWFRLSGEAAKIRAGSYELRRGITPHELLRMLVRGDEVLARVTLPEGWTFRQWREHLGRQPHLQGDSRSLDGAALMAALGRPGLHPEGRFFPDTYGYSRGSSDLDLLRRALRAMERELEAAWSQRSADVALRDPYEALILASIIEKETGMASDRPLVSGVFHNRLRIGMPLQSDPTVIYGMGASFDGNLRRRDLIADTPWNSYTRPGLPPTPIANPGRAALLSAVQPARTQALYFVARGDGSSEFSRTLDEHNRAVNRYIRNR